MKNVDVVFLLYILVLVITMSNVSGVKLLPRVAAKDL